MDKHLLPVRKGRAKKPSDASVLLHAIVVALRDDLPRHELIKLVAIYPRIMNRSNPFVPLVEEIATLRERLGEKVDQLELLKEIDGKLITWTNHRADKPEHSLKAFINRIWKKRQVALTTQ